MWPQSIVVVTKFAVCRKLIRDAEHLVCIINIGGRRVDWCGPRKSLLQRRRVDVRDGVLAKLMSPAEVALMCCVRGRCLVDECRSSPLLAANRSASGLSTFGTCLYSDRCGIGVALRLALAVFAIASSRTNAVLDSMFGESPIACLLRACFLVGRRDSFKCLYLLSKSLLRTCQKHQPRSWTDCGAHCSANPCCRIPEPSSYACVPIHRDP